MNKRTIDRRTFFPLTAADGGAVFRESFGSTFVIHSTTREYILLHSTTCPTRAPDLKPRADLAPGRVVRLPFTPTVPGTIDFFCDNFCGGGHEEMNGKLIFKAWTEPPCVC